ncbi:oxalate:formate antiporter-like [Oscarella lobularis]|uniref:oxalate:formate antiporter-like n=1 Tax=Oscarella lobularis TaxID=121494 RepID=UPI003313EC31
MVTQRQRRLNLLRGLDLRSSNIGSGPLNVFRWEAGAEVGHAALLGSLTMSVGVALSYFTIESFWLLLITYGFVFGFGVGIAYPIPMACAIRWLPKRKGFAAGCVVSGFGLGAFIFDQVQTAFINPDGIKPVGDEGSTERYFEDPQVLKRTKQCFLILGALYTILQVISAFFLVDPKPDDEAEESNDSVQLTSITSSENPLDLDSILSPGSDEETSDTELILAQSSDVKFDNSNPVDFKPKQLFRQKTFYLIWIMFLLSGQGVITVSTLYKAYGFGFIKSDQFLAISGAIASLSNASGRIIWSYLADKFSFRFTAMVMMNLMTALLLTFSATSLAGKGMFLAWTTMLFFCIGGVFSLFPAATVRAFGSKYFASNYGLVFSSQVIAGPVGAFLPTILSQSLGYIGVWYLSAGLVYIAVLVTYCCSMRHPAKSFK